MTGFELTDTIEGRNRLKEYYEIVDEARPLSGFFPTHADFFYRNAFLIMKLKQASKFQSDPSTN